MDIDQGSIYSEDEQFNSYWFSVSNNKKQPWKKLILLIVLKKN